jgi:ABC-type dipeptide/oligopeptide/nickel transport system ATPase subunit
MTRTFSAVPAVRESVPLLVGLTGPSGGGKTFSALRLATGIQTVTGGDIYAIDTEARRMLHYADKFRFRHLQFDAPFGSLDYLAAIRYCAAEGARVIIVDSMSHEHEGPGGLLDYQAHEFERLGGRDAIKMLAWQKPKAARQQLLNGILQIPANFIFCFRAKEKIKMAGGKVIPQGFMPIAGEEFVFEMTVNALLMPHADGVPTWHSEEPGERMMMKLPEQFREVFSERRALSEDIGRELAAWAAGGSTSVSPIEEPTEAAKLLWSVARGSALHGQAALQAHWKGLNKLDRKLVSLIMDELKVTATEADAMREPATTEGEI